MKYIKNKKIKYIRNLLNRKIQRINLEFTDLTMPTCLQCFYETFCQKLAFIYLICWKYLCNIGYHSGGYKDILSHRVPIFPCILLKQEIQYYYHYLDHPSEMMNSLSEQKFLKIDDTGNKFSKIWGKYYETSFIHNSSFRSPRCNNRIRVRVTMQACVYQLLYAESGHGFCSSCDHDCKQSSWRNNVQRVWL